MVDNRFPAPGTDARFSAPGVDEQYPSPDTDTQYPTPGTDTRFGEGGYTPPPVSEGEGWDGGPPLSWIGPTTEVYPAIDWTIVQGYTYQITGTVTEATGSAPTLRARLGYNITNAFTLTTTGYFDETHTAGSENSLFRLIIDDNTRNDTWAISGLSITHVYAPIVTNVVISGNAYPNGFLVASYDIDASPYAAAEVQWRKDGIDIPGAIGNRYVPVEGDVGADIDCVVSATNYQGTGSDTSNAITISELPPVFQGGIPAQTFSQGQAITPLDVSGYWTGQLITFASSDLPAGLVISTAGVISGTPTGYQDATNSEIIASNGGGDAPGDISIRIHVAPPVYGGGLSSQSWTRNTPITPYDVSPFFTGDGLSFSAGGLPQGLRLSSAGMLTGTPTIVTSGTITIYCDNANPADPVEGTFTFDVVTDITAPTYDGGLTSKTWQLNEAITPYDASPFFSGPSIVFSAEDLPNGLFISTGGLITGTPVLEAEGIATVTATNSEGSAPGTFTWTVETTTGPATFDSMVISMDTHQHSWDEVS